MNEPSDLTRQPWIAAVLSLLCTGLGHIYCGHTVKGLILFLVSLLFMPMVVLAAWAGPATWVLWLILIAALGVWGVYLFAVLDAYRVARPVPSPYSLHSYNHPVVYGLFVLIGVIYPVGSAILVRDSVLEAFYIPTSSMTPSFLNGDRVLVNKIAGRRGTPGRGEVIVFRPPGQRDMRYIKRVIGLPGDTVGLRGDDLYVNGRKLQRDRVPSSQLTTIPRQATGRVLAETNAGKRYLVMFDPDSGSRPDFPTTTVPEDRVFVLGDNRHKSRDSRDFGSVPIGDILGPVQYVYWPAEAWWRFGVVTGWEK